ncbi:MULTISPECIES: O-methyltransferase [unclassified Streptomyces]|uniref:O-methyltransferase n=1 Tax=unclassified Streptomyces TaxID=2593676 RepID=UPI00136CDDFD|nr:MULTISPECIES: class I SAM-dependent methyltransferase [unclassified Streptomyces]MCW5251285.1 class I SAM-dependent methyltransferase [Streptomyces sp. SHP 1-2]MYU22661.1 methyltransferase domain-containing protein [Streptomyces sp. SID8352]
MRSAVQDPLSDLKDATLAHQRAHGCGSHPFGDGARLAAWAVDAGARTAVEIGTSLGYSAACLAGAGARVHTVDRDPVHTELAQKHLGERGLADRVSCVTGEAVDVFAELPAGGADLAFFDGMEVSVAEVEVLARALRPGGLLIVSNMKLGGEEAEVRELLGGWRPREEGEELFAVKPGQSR